MGNLREVFARYYGAKAREDELKAAADPVLNGRAAIGTSGLRSV